MSLCQTTRFRGPIIGEFTSRLPRCSLLAFFYSRMGDPHGGAAVMERDNFWAENVCARSRSAEEESLEHSFNLAVTSRLCSSSGLLRSQTTSEPIWMLPCHSPEAPR